MSVGAAIKDAGKPLAKRKVVKKKAPTKLESQVAAARKAVKSGKGPKADTGSITRDTKVVARPKQAAKADIKAAMESVAKTARTKQLKKIEEKKTVGGLAKNVVRNARDIVTGLPASAYTIVKAGGEELANAGNALARPTVAGRARKPGVKPIKEGIQRDDPLYALGEAAVKKVKGDDKGAAKALDRAGDNAYERPLDAAAYVAGGAGAAGRAATVVKHRGKGGVAAATARPPKRVGGEGTSSKAQVERQREGARAEVRARQGDEAAKATAAKVVRKPAVRKEQRYSANAVTRTVQKANENRKAKKGVDPFQATPRQARRIRKRRFDEHSRNTHAGGLAREQRAAEDAHRERKELGKDPTKVAAADLLVNDRVRPDMAVDDLKALRRTVIKRDPQHPNVRVLDELIAKPEILRDPKVVNVSVARRDGLRESERRVAGEGFFGNTDPAFVAALQPRLARGEVVQRSAGDPPPKVEGGQPTPPSSRREVERPAARPVDPTPGTVPAGGAKGFVERNREADVADETWRGAGANRAPDAGHPTKWLQRLDAEIALLELASREKLLHSRDPKIERAGGRGKRRVAFSGGDRERLAELRAERATVAKEVERLRVLNGPSRKKVVKVPGRPMPKVRELTPQERVRRGEAPPSEHMAGLLADSAVEGAVGGHAVPAGVDAPGGSGRARLTGPADEAVGDQPDRQHNAGREQQVGGEGRQPAAHGAVPSQATPAARKGTAVRVERDGYYWTSGPKAGRRVTEADLAGEQGAFIRGLDGDSKPNTDLTQPRAGHGYSAEDAILGDLTGDRVLKTRLDRERQITLIRLARVVEQDFAQRSASGEVRFAHDRARQLATRMDGMDTLAVSKTDSIVVPKEIAARWKRQISEPGRVERTGRYVTRQFVRTVLPFSVGWQAGNVADLYTRLVVADARFAVPGLAGRSGREILDALQTSMRDLDPHLAGELTDSLKGHFGSRETIAPLKFSGLTHDAKREFVREFGEAVSAIRDVKGVHGAAEAGRKATDAAFGLGVKAESAMVRRAAGSAIETYAKALGHDVADHQALGRKLATEFKDDPAKLLEFQRRTLEITGDYVTRGPRTKYAQRVFMPFIQWIKVANKFVFHTLPARHPYKTAMMLWAASVTEDERRRLGLSGYITPEEAKRLGLEPPQEGYLAGAIPLPGGKSLPVSPLTSFGEAARIIEGVENIADDGDDYGKTLASPIVPFVQAPVRQGLDYGPLVGANRAAEAFVPGLKQARRVQEGERPHPRSTIIRPIGTGGKSTADRILAGMSAPVGREFPEDRPRAGEEGRIPVKVGESFDFTIGGPGGKKRTIRVRRTR